MLHNGYTPPPKKKYSGSGSVVMFVFPWISFLESRGEVVAKVRGLLLCSPDPERWRRTLHDLLLDYVMEQAKRDAITFVLNMVRDASL